MGLTFNPEVWQINHLELTVRLTLAIVLGGLIGLERELGGHHAGFRTHILVCLGSAAIMLLSMYGFSEYAAEPNVRMDPARLAAQVISGIGFLGAGTIVRTGLTISGLTTAASLWVVAAIGLSVGAGFYYGASISTFLVVVSLFFLNKVEKNFSHAKKDRQITFVLHRKTSSLQHIVTSLNKSGIKIYKLTIENEEAAEGSAQPLIIKMDVKLKKTKAFDEALLKLAGIEGVIRLKTAGDVL
ncbi:MgtC/SapB family protein [Paenibacillus beijingensis]|uniref:MgtC/SapB transporter n=1 Tax=Paenibacillus beijingensis TaxID=1126833 RepID=A0A0D5NIL0_9BACL|nr:MgtC/SapB family protein [Paenibacillus beijingensis]AJY74758.1 MgtC/SapB transporter [Paenibacillus beijingensis]